MERGGWVYILTNESNKVLYTGVTSNLKVRIYEHKEKSHPSSFTAKYNVCKLVFFEAYSSIEEAIAYEKKIKGGSRLSKIKLIESINPLWKELCSEEMEV